VTEELEAKGAAGDVALLDDNPFAFQYSLTLSPAGKERVERMIELGQPVAVYVAPPDAHL
jgi:hypothetical protein